MLKIGAEVTTEHGNGKIIGYDLPESKSKRYIVKITEEFGTPILKSSFPNNELTYFSHEIMLR